MLVKQLAENKKELEAIVEKLNKQEENVQLMLKKIEENEHQPIDKQLETPSIIALYNQADEREKAKLYEILEKAILERQRQSNAIKNYPTIPVEDDSDEDLSGLSSTKPKTRHRRSRQKSTLRQKRSSNDKKTDTGQKATNTTDTGQKVTNTTDTSQKATNTTDTGQKATNTTDTGQKVTNTTDTSQKATNTTDTGQKATNTTDTGQNATNTTDTGQKATTNTTNTGQKATDTGQKGTDTGQKSTDTTNDTLHLLSNSDRCKPTNDKFQIPLERQHSFESSKNEIEIITESDDEVYLDCKTILNSSDSCDDSFMVKPEPSTQQGSYGILIIPDIKIFQNIAHEDEIVVPKEKVSPPIDSLLDSGDDIIN